MASLSLCAVFLLDGICPLPVFLFLVVFLKINLRLDLHYIVRKKVLNFTFMGHMDDHWASTFKVTPIAPFKQGTSCDS